MLDCTQACVGQLLDSIQEQQEKDGEWDTISIGGEVEAKGMVNAVCNQNRNIRNRNVRWQLKT